MFSGEIYKWNSAISCINCPNGFYTINEGSSKCQSCINGTYSITLGSNTRENCVICPSGKISGRGSQSCTFCPEGKWSRQQKSCVNCPNGKYSFSIGLASAEKCSLCPIGKYSDITGIIYERQCKECASGYIGVIDGASSNISCLPCEKGKFRENIQSCAHCADGSVAKQSEDQCASCPKGKVSDSYKINCVDCPKGKFNDVPKSHTISMCKNCVTGRYSNITGLINFCGITHNKSFEEIVKVNYMCSFEILNFFSNYVIKNKIKKSSVINITSLNSELGFTKNPGYVSTKGALKMLTKSFAVDYADYGIRFNNVGPGYFLTPMTKKNYLNKAKRLERKKRIPLGRYGEPKEINGIITYLLTEASSYVTGQDFYVDGGFLAKGI